MERVKSVKRWSWRSLIEGRKVKMETKKEVRRWKKGWKVVRFFAERGEYKSLYRSTIYSVGVKTYPPKQAGPLTVLKEKKGALFLLKESTVRLSEVWECRYLSSLEGGVWSDSFEKRDFIYLEKLEASTREILLEGTTDLADVVILIKREGPGWMGNKK
jgi:hypothetical protein